MNYLALLFFFGFTLSAIEQDLVLDHLLKSKTHYIFEREGMALLFSGSLQTRAYPFGDILISGMYKLSSTVNKKITITVSNVTLDMNGNTVTGGIEINTGLRNITIKNGQVDVATGSVTDAIKINAGCSNITIDNVVAKNASASGISLDTVTNSFVTNCDFTQNSTGLSLQTCANIMLQKCTAQCNVVTGFELSSSTTCSLLECNALSTGIGNTALADATVFGFVSANGYGNIFERCIANSTQALSTTDFNSVVAGFALRGSEGCSKIIDSEAANATTAPDGVTVPYGILLEAEIDNPFTLTAVPVNPIPSNQVRSVNWSSDGNYLAAGTDTPQIQIYEFDRLNKTLTQVAIPDVTPGDLVFSVNWSPDGNYLAAGMNSGDTVRIRIYQFDRINNSLSQVAVPTGSDIPGTLVLSVNWSPDGNYLAAGIGSSGESFRIRIYQFDRISNSLSQVAVPTGSDIPGSNINSVNWSPDGEYLAAGGNDSTRIRIYSFNNNTLTQVAVPTGSDIPGGIVRTVNWSPDGEYLAAGTDGSSRIRIYEFDRLSTSITQVATPSPVPSTLTFSVNWSPDGKYLASSHDTADAERIRIYQFDRGADSLIQVATPDSIPNDQSRTVNWSLDGAYLGAGTNTSDSLRILIYNVLNFPSKNVIKNNTVYCNSGAQFPSGVGISGSSIANMIIGNIAYSNPIPQTDIEGGGPIVFSNYYFVTNVFNELFNNAPSPLQNISLGGCVPIATPADEKLLFISNAAKACDIQTKVNQLILNVA